MVNVHVKARTGLYVTHSTYWTGCLAASSKSGSSLGAAAETFAPLLAAAFCLCPLMALSDLNRLEEHFEGRGRVLRPKLL